MTIALRTQQVIAHESGVTNIVDPLGGSYFVESVDGGSGRGVAKYWGTMDRMGGMVEAMSAGSRRRKWPRPPYQYQHRSTRDRLIVGVNDFLQTRRRADRDAVDRRQRRRASGLNIWKS